MFFSRLIRKTIDKISNVQQQTVQGVELMQFAFFRSGIILIASIVAVWISIFLYTAFYYAYMPSMQHTRPVHLQFKSCDDVKGICSYPSASAQLTKKQQLLMVGQPYKINLYLEMPESTVNKELGMFLVCSSLSSRDGFEVDNSCRPTMLHYRSTLLHFLTTLTFSPALIFGSREEKQNIVVELFSNFEEDQSHPVTSIEIQIQSRFIEFYSATIGIHAHLSGLRYLMFHWPISAAIVGITTNLFFISLICILSYLHFTHEDDLQDEQFIYEKGQMEKNSSDKNSTDVSSESSSIEDASLLDDIIKSTNESNKLELNLPQDKSHYIEEIKSIASEPVSNK
ncbi:seipin [Microplitis mediator]|uniref:seipin n=1 Tax=Microplitis mediator TaxID=375433 RepID=UPI0025558243|nr:seipin [Microplitis mediator]